MSLREEDLNPQHPGEMLWAALTVFAIPAGLLLRKLYIRRQLGVLVLATVAPFKNSIDSATKDANTRPHHGRRPTCTLARRRFMSSNSAADDRSQDPVAIGRQLLRQFNIPGQSD